MDNIMQPTMSTDGFDNKVWKLHGKLHRTDGPAFEHANGTNHWFLHDRHHRTDGPAIEWHNGDKDWYLHGEDMPFDTWLDQNPDMTGEEKVMYKLEYG
jgi:hypothetical protein